MTRASRPARMVERLGDQGNPVRVAVVGYGLGGSAFHAPLISVTPGLSLDAVVTANPDRQAAARSRYPDASVVATVDDLMARAADFDLAVVTVPNAAHVDVAAAALRAGLHVVVDKPVAPSAREVLELARIARDVDRRMIPYHNRRWDGDFRTIRALISRGDLGQVWRVESRFERWVPRPIRSGTWKQDPALPAAGVLYDLGVHLIDQALVLFGPPTSVYAEVAARRGGSEDDAFVALGYGSGPVVQLWASTCAAQVGPRFRVLGSEGAYVKYGLDVQEAALRAGRLPTEPEWGEEPSSAWGLLGTIDDAQPLPTLPGAYQDFYAAAAACLLEGGEQPVAVADAAVVIRIIEAAHRSAAEEAITGLD